MFQAFRRLLRSLGFYGLVTLAGGAFTFYVVVVIGLRRTGLMPVISIAILVAGLIGTAGRWGGYARSVGTAPYPGVLWPLVRSREEFCLILRPFGHDGEVLLPVEHRTRRGRLRRPLTSAKPLLTLEQVVAEAARTAHGVRAYALVDQKRRLAPPGPVYLRSPAKEWRVPIQEMIKRAHTIVLLLPPKQELRAALNWELKQIVAHGRQSRVVVVLPPFDKWRSRYPRARRQLGAVLAVLSGRWDGDVAEVPGPVADLCLAPILPRTVVVKVDEAGQARPWMVTGGRFTFVGVTAYLGALDEAIRLTEHESRDLGFEARYPDAVPGDDDGPPVRPLAGVAPEPAPRRFTTPAALLAVVLVLAAVTLVRNVGNDPIGTVRSTPPTIRPFTFSLEPSVPPPGSGHACGVVDRQLRCAGDNEHGQLGTGDLRRRDAAVNVATEPGWTAHDTGGAHTCGLRQGALWCWGDNAEGQLGFGDRTDRHRPAPVPGRERWKWIATGRAHTCALRTDHTLWCWGDGSRGQLGAGDDKDRSRPHRIGRSARWASVFAGADASCGFQDGTLWCWGTKYEQVSGGAPGSSRTPARAG